MALETQPPQKQLVPADDVALRTHSPELVLSADGTALKTSSPPEILLPADVVAAKSAARKRKKQCLGARRHTTSRIVTD